MLLQIIVLLKILVATFTDTYKRIQSRSDLEWKHGRAKLILNIDRSSVTPPPLNIFTALIALAKHMTKKGLNMSSYHSMYYCLLCCFLAEKKNFSRKVSAISAASTKASSHDSIMYGGGGISARRSMLSINRSGMSRDSFHKICLTDPTFHHYSRKLETSPFPANWSYSRHS